MEEKNLTLNPQIQRAEKLNGSEAFALEQPRANPPRAHSGSTVVGGAPGSGPRAAGRPRKSQPSGLGAGWRAPVRGRRHQHRVRGQNLQVAGQAMAWAKPLCGRDKEVEAPPPQGARPPALLPPSGHAAAPPPRPTSFPGRGGDERRPAGRRAGPEGGRGRPRGYAARSPRGAAGVRGAGLPARRGRSGRGTPSRRPLSGLSLALSAQECGAGSARLTSPLTSQQAARPPGGLLHLGSRERVDVGLKVAVTSCARVCVGNA